MSNHQTRCASHASSWYSDNREALSRELEAYLSNTQYQEGVALNFGSIWSVIAPHAGYRYSGQAAAYCYRALRERLITNTSRNAISRIIVVGPSHHVYLRDRAALPPRDTRSLQTPLGQLSVDIESAQSLATDFPHLFTPRFTAQQDEDEHSLEMHYPYLAHILQGRPIPILPIVVGNTSADTELSIAKALLPLLRDSLVVISSDFCHWGSRFGYQYGVNDRTQPIHKSIEALDQRGIALISSQDTTGFYQYLHETENTICGRHPIGILLNLLDLTKSHNNKVQFVHYGQSNAVTSHSDSSVSYASAIIHSSS